MSPADEKLFLIFLLFHLYFYAQGYDAVDLVVGVTSLVSDASTRRSVEIALSNRLRSTIILEDVNSNFEMSVVDIADRSIFIDTLNHFLKYINIGISNDAAKFVNGLVESIILELDRHEFYTRRARSFHKSETKKLKDEKEEASLVVSTQAAERDALAAECDRLAAALAETAAARDADAHALAARARLPIWEKMVLAVRGG